MRFLKLNQFTGRRAKTGNLCFDDRGRMGVFVAYCDCNRKVVMELREAEIFASRYSTERRKPSNRYLLNKLEKMTIHEPQQTKYEHFR